MATKVTLETLLERAQDLRPKEVVRLQFDPVEAKRACNTGLKTAKKHARPLREKFPGFSLDELLLLPDLCDALKNAQRKAQNASSPARSREIINGATKWRRALLPLAQTFAEAGKVDAREVAVIASGTGVSDTVQDVLDLVELLAPMKTAAESVLGAGALGNASSAAKAALAAIGSVGEDNSEEGDQRDRLATIVTQLHERLRTAVAAVTTYNEAATLVPPVASGGGAKLTAPDEGKPKEENE